MLAAMVLAGAGQAFAQDVNNDTRDNARTPGQLFEQLDRERGSGG
jgi:hypothetical protein